MKESAESKARANWDAYCKATEPHKRRAYARAYEFWKSLCVVKCDCMGNPHIECNKSEEWHKANPL